MKNKEYIEQMKNIKAPEDLIKKTISNINRTEQFKKMNKVNYFKRTVAGIATVVTLTVGSAAAYTAITGNSVLDLIGLHKASEKYEEKSVDISSQYDTVIENEYTRMEIKKIACDQTLLIMEYDVKVKEDALNIVERKDENFKSNIDYDYSQGGICENLGIVSDIFINGKYMQGYTCYSTKVEETENEYKFFEIVDLTGLGDKKVNATIAVISLDYNEYAFPVTNTNNAYIMEFSINNENENKNEEQEYESENCKLKIKDVVNTDFTSYVTLELNFKNKNSENILNNFEIKSIDGNAADVESRAFLKKYIVTTKDGNKHDLLNDIEKTNKYEENRYLLDSENLEIAKKQIDIQEDLNDADITMEYTIMYPNLVGENDIICSIEKNQRTIFEGIKIHFSEENNSNITIDKLELHNYTDKEFADSENNSIVDKKTINNDYHNSDSVDYIDIQNYEICGVKIGLSKEEAQKKLKEFYESKGVNIDPEITEDYYEDEYIIINFENDQVSLINAVYFSNINNNIIKIDDVISKYYSDKDFTISNQGTRNDTIVILYGEDDYENNFMYGKYAYANMDSAGRITCVVYADGGLKITFNVDAVSQTINQIFIMD